MHLLLDLKKNATELTLKTILEASGWCVFNGPEILHQSLSPWKLHHPYNPNGRLLSILSFQPLLVQNV